MHLPIVWRPHCNWSQPVQFFHSQQLRSHSNRFAVGDGEAISGTVTHIHTSRILCYKRQKVSQTHTKMETGKKKREKIYIKLEKTKHISLNCKMKATIVGDGTWKYIYVFTQINLICKICPLLCINSRRITLYSM